MHGMTAIVKTVARGMAGMIFLYGIYIVLHGHLTPGGGFAGGVMLAAAFILVSLAKGAPQAASEARKEHASAAESLGILTFWVLAMAGLIGGTFFVYNFVTKGRPFRLFSGGFIPLSNIAIGVEVGGALLVIFTMLTVFKTGGEK